MRLLSYIRENISFVIIVGIMLSVFGVCLVIMLRDHYYWKDAKIKTYSGVLVAYQCKKANDVWVKIDELNIIYEIPNAGSHSIPDVDLGEVIYISFKEKDGKRQYENSSLTTTYYGFTNLPVSQSGGRFDCLPGYEYLEN